MADRKTRIPTSLDEEDPFLSLSALKLSLRQLLTILLSCLLWVICLKITTFIIPLSGVFGGLIWSWILILGVFLTFWKKDGRPYEEFLSHKIVFMISSKTFIQKDPNAKYGSVEDADWEDLDDGPPQF
jgi:hypothetical protein